MSRRGKKDTRPFWAGDCETDPFHHGRVPKPFIWGLYTGAGYHEFANAEDFVEFIRDCNVIVYFHNGGKFDMHFLLQYINLDGPVTVINGRLVVAHIGLCEFRDSWNILPVPLASYKKDDFDYTLMEERVRHKHMPLIRQYLKNDCLFLYELIDAFERENGRHLTLAGAAMRRWLNMVDVPKPSSSREFFQAFNPWYNGGRVECFQKGKIDGPVNVYDIRSAYMWAMQHPHPFGTEYVTTTNPQGYSDNSFLTVECISTGALPFRGPRGNLSFPADNEYRTYHVCGHELRAATETGSVRRVRLLESIDFVQEMDYAPYVKMCHDRRMTARELGDKATDVIEKLFGNGLYGKWAANPDNYGNFICVPFQQMEAYICEHDTPEICHWHGDCDGYKFDGMIGPHALLRAPLHEWQSHFLNVATAASITSMVRAKLWRAIHASVDPMYCDTDSLFCRVAYLPIGEELGLWQHEGTASTFYVAGKKMYLCEGLFDKNGKPKMATKGVRLTPEQIRRACRGETVVYEPEAPTFSLRKEPVFTNRAIRMT